LFIDLDRFKEVNDTLGHEKGDMLLKEAANRLLDCVRETDVVGRLGGDEFTIILSDLEDTYSIDRIAEKILRSMAEPFNMGQEMAYISASIGMTLFPEDAADMEGLLKNADQAMYESKHQGRNRFNYFKPIMQEAALQRVALASELRKAIAEKQFTLFYQPIVDMKSGAIIKAEALIRWFHPEKGIVSPANFIPVAEEMGLIVEIGDWVFLEAATQAAKWQSILHDPIQISINKSPVQFNDIKPPERSWIAQLNRLGLDGKHIVIEITEGLLLDANDSINAQLLELSEAGIQVSIDDFGTGYSSLSYLKKFHIDYLKIDQSFVSGLSEDSNDKALCEAIIVMAHKLGMMVIAEGIETEQQLEILREAHCDFGQGYLFSRPIPAEEFESLVLSGKQAQVL
jgi:diguanylate cyclase (GGDEF)-like protein